MYNLDLARKWPLLFRDLSLARWAESPPELESQARCLLPSLQGACLFVHLPVLLLSAITWVGGRQRLHSGTQPHSSLPKCGLNNTLLSPRAKQVTRGQKRRLTVPKLPQPPLCATPAHLSLLTSPRPNDSPCGVDVGTETQRRGGACQGHQASSQSGLRRRSAWGATLTPQHLAIPWGTLHYSTPCPRPP